MFGIDNEWAHPRVSEHLFRSAGEMWSWPAWIETGLPYYTHMLGLETLVSPLLGPSPSVCLSKADVHLKDLMLACSFWPSVFRLLTDLAFGTEIRYRFWLSQRKASRDSLSLVNADLGEPNNLSTIWYHRRITLFLTGISAAELCSCYLGICWSSELSERAMV